MTMRTSKFRHAVSRRAFLSGAAGAASVAATGSLLPRRAHAAGELNVLVWCDHADSKLLEPFEQAHDVKVNAKTYEGTGTALVDPRAVGAGRLGRHRYRRAGRAAGRGPRHSDRAAR